MVINESAKLNVNGKNPIGLILTKSTTAPLTSLSYKLPNAPPKIRVNEIHLRHPENSLEALYKKYMIKKVNPIVKILIKTSKLSPISIPNAR